MKKLPYLYYKGVSSLDLSLVIKSKGTYNAAERDLTFVSVPGRNGDLIQDNGRYKNVTIPYELSLVKKDNRTFINLIEKIKNWLSGDGGYYELWDSYDPRYFRYAAVTGALNITEIFYETGEIPVSFNCKPFRYSFDGQKPIIVTNNHSAISIFNPETIAARPYIKIFGSGAGSISVNNLTMTFSNIDGYIELDSETMNAYQGTTLLNNTVTGNAFPSFKPGTNNISFTGSITGAEIVPRWCTK